MSKDQKDWDRHIPEILFAYRVSPSDVTGESPFYLLYGREPRLPMDVNLLTPKDLSPSIVEHRKRIVQSIEHSHRIAKENIQRAQQKMKLYYDLKAQKPNYESQQEGFPVNFNIVGMALIGSFRNPPLCTFAFEPVTLIVRSLPQYTLIEWNQSLTPMKDPFCPLHRMTPPHSIYLLMIYPPDSFVPDPTTDESRPDPLGDDPSVFSAERTLRKRIRNGKPQYFVKWAGYPEREGTWEPEEHLHDPRLLQEFNNRTYSCPQDPPVAEHAQ